MYLYGVQTFAVLMDYGGFVQATKPPKTVRVKKICADLSAYKSLWHLQLLSEPKILLLQQQSGSFQNGIK